MKNTVIFDLDGTILNTLDDLTDAVNFAMASHGFPTHSADKIKTFVGNGIRKLVERSVPQNCSEEILNESFLDFCRYYEAHMNDKTAPYDGIEELLKELQEAGFKTAVVTNKADFAAQALCKKMFGDLITVTVGANDNIRHKPCPDGTLKALEFLGESAENSYFVGDSDVDVKTAENAEIDFIGVLWGFRDKAVLKSAGATEFAENMQELKRLLIGKNNVFAKKLDKSTKNCNNIILE